MTDTSRGHLAFYNHLNRAPPSRYKPYVGGYLPEDIKGEGKSSFYTRLRRERDWSGPYHRAVARALEIRDDHSAGKPLPPLPRPPTPIAEPTPPGEPISTNEPPVTVTMRIPRALHDRLRDHAHGARQKHQAVFVAALEAYLAKGTAA